MARVLAAAAVYIVIPLLTTLMLRLPWLVDFHDKNCNVCKLYTPTKNLVLCDLCALLWKSTYSLTLSTCYLLVQQAC